MKKLLIGSVVSGLLAALPLLALPPAPAISLFQLFASPGATSNTSSATVDVSRMVNGAVQICSTDAAGATVVAVKVRMGSTFPWYQAAILSGTVPLCTGNTTVGYITMPLATQMSVEVSGYATGHIFAAYGERAF